MTSGTRLTGHDQLRRGQHGGLAAVLPAAAGAAHATLTRRPFLRPRAADVDDLVRLGRPLARRPIRAVSGLWLRGRRRGLKRRKILRATFHNERRGGRPQESAEQQPRQEERRRQQQRPLQTRPTETRRALMAEPTARPHAPTRAHDALAALAAEVRLVQGFRISSDVEDASSAAPFRRHSAGLGGEPVSLQLTLRRTGWIIRRRPPAVKNF
ncbi:MAG: hypothetical protein QOH49_2050 [Acidobacteriota bacterium]|nr:hypothetical protein [Acidobacteriota bacterium]